MRTVNHFPVYSIFSPSMLFEIFPAYFWKARLNPAFPEKCYIECLKRSVTANICKAPGETLCSRIKIDEASVEPFNWWLLNYLEHTSPLCLFGFYSGKKHWFQGSLSKETTGEKSNQVVLRGTRTFLFCFLQRGVCPKYVQHLVHKDGVSYLTGEFQKRMGNKYPSSFCRPPLWSS